MSAERWLVNRHTHGETVHDRDCPHADETMPPHPALRHATREQAVSFCRVATRTKMCRRCARRNLR